MSNETFKSVWDAIEDTPAEAENMKLRSALMMALDKHIRSQGWTQAEAARQLGVTQPRVSDPPCCTNHQASRRGPLPRILAS